MFQRYAVYYLPDDADLAAFGAAWLGWDVETGAMCQRPDIDGLDAATATPQKYGFHGTLKPPFKLAHGTYADALALAVEGLAKRTPAFTLEGLKPARIGSFLALVPTGDTTQLAQLALTCVTELDAFRRPADPGELHRRRAAGLTPRQDALLEQWGYPYVADQFRFHLTLSGKLDAARQETLMQALGDHMPPLPAPFQVASIALTGERSDGTFQLIHRYALTG